MGNKIKNSLFGFFFIIILLPALQQAFPFITSGPLNGWVNTARDTAFSWNDWWGDTYQWRKSNYINDNIGFRSDFTRLNNQVVYSLFDKITNITIVAGKNHSLYMGSYIDSYYGRDYVGYDSLLQKMTKLKAISDTFSRLGKSVVLIYAPSKEFMYPEYIPDQCASPRRSVTNFETCLRIGDSLKIKQIDFNTWFCSMKNTSKEVLYTKQGIHWSVYGSLIAADSMIRYLEKLRNINMQHPVWTNIVHTNKPRDTDDDIERIVNLIFPVANELLSYPEVSYRGPDNAAKPKVIYLGDSFLGMWLTDGIMEHTNKDWQVWEWFNTVITADGKPQPEMPFFDWVTAINNTECLVIVYTTKNIPILGHGFIEKAYDYYYPKKVK
jgi:hypothetical protein